MRLIRVSAGANTENCYRSYCNPPQEKRPPVSFGTSKVKAPVKARFAGWMRTTNCEAAFPKMSATACGTLRPSSPFYEGRTKAHEPEMLNSWLAFLSPLGRLP